MQRKSPHQGKHYYVENEEGCGSGVESRRLSNEWNMYVLRCRKYKRKRG